MAAGEVRADADWLALREPADSAARATELLEEMRPLLPETRETLVHDLGCGTGAMARWLAPRLPGPQHWVLHDRDAELLTYAAARPPERALDGAAVTVETRCGDVTRLDDAEPGDADLVTASALLDMLTADELDRLVDVCTAGRCPVLVTLSVTGQVDLRPADPLDERLADAFNDHQRRTTSAGPLLGPDAVAAAVAGFRRRGRRVLVRPSPWRLHAEQRALSAAWFEGWLSAACEQRPELADEVGPYARWRRAQAAAGRLAATVHHADLLVLHR